jgi:hypothetical protein
MSDELQSLLRLVADGRLTPDEAAPIIEALARAQLTAGPAEPASTASAAEERVQAIADTSTPRTGRHLRIRVSEHGRQVVNLRIPLAFADMAMRMVPGIGEDQSQRIRAAMDAGAIGPIVDVEDETGDGVLISVE